MSRARAFGYAFKVGWAELVRDIWVPTWIVRVVSNALFFSLVGHLLGSQERVQFLVLGNVVAAGALATAIAVAISTWDRFDGTYPLLVIAPTSLLVPTVGRTACRLVTGVGASVVALITLGPLFDLPVSWAIVASIVPLLIVTAISTYCLMLFLGAVANYAPSARNLIHNVAAMSLIGFCGVNVPVEFWPIWLQAMVNVLPMTHGLAAVRLLFDGADQGSVLRSAIAECAVGIGWFAVAALTMDRMANAGRANGSIELMR